MANGGTTHATFTACVLTFLGCRNSKGAGRVLCPWLPLRWLPRTSVRFYPHYSAVPVAVAPSCLGPLLPAIVLLIWENGRKKPMRVFAVQARHGLSTARTCHAKLRVVFVKTTLRFALFKQKTWAFPLTRRVIP